MRLPFLIAGLCCVGIALAGEAESGAAAVMRLSEARWAAPGADLVRLLTTTPGECVFPPPRSGGGVRSEATDGGGAPREAMYLAEIGRAAFSSPLLLGGQAAKNGLSCASCHVDGRDNPHFFLEGLSDKPGTADISSSIFSKVRDDGVFNPVPIPSLAGVKGKAFFGAHAKAPSLEAFIESAVADEFSGAAMSRAVLEGLAAYIEQMTPQACSDAPSAMTPQRAMNDVARTLAASREAASRDDAATADFLLVSAQSALGRIHARFPGERFEEERAALVELSSRIAEVRPDAAAGRPPPPLAGEVSGAKRLTEGALAASAANADRARPLSQASRDSSGGAGPSLDDLASIERDVLKLGTRLEQKKRGSLYDPEAISAALEKCPAC